MVKVLNKDTVEEIVKKSNKPVIIDVMASWCGPCQHMKPVFEQVAQELADAYEFATLNVDEARELAIEYGVTSVPTLIFIKDGDIKGKETGFMTAENLKAKIKEHLEG